MLSYDTANPAQVVDADMKAPSNNLGWVDVDAAVCVPATGSTWEQWLPLKGTRAQAEVLIKLAHLAPWSGVQVGLWRLWLCDGVGCDAHVRWGAVECVSVRLW